MNNRHAANNMPCEGQGVLECLHIILSNTNLVLLAKEINGILCCIFWVGIRLIRMGCNGVISVSFVEENSISNKHLDVHVATPKTNMVGGFTENQSLSLLFGTKETNETECCESIKKITGVEDSEMVIEVVSPVLLEDPRGDSVEDPRGDSEGQATECSSSFCSTGDELSGAEDKNSEVESVPWDENDGDILKEVNAQHLKRKKALNAEWKVCRQGIEWRCRWLELRVKELQTKLLKYEKLLMFTKRCKDQVIDLQETSTSRIAQANHTKRIRILHRQSRRKEEERTDMKECMSKHPLFSRYEKKKKDSYKGLLASEHCDDEANHGMLEFDDMNDDDDELMSKLGDQENSVEWLPWHIEALQTHASKLKAQLNRCCLMQRSALKGNARDPARSIFQGFVGPSNASWGQKSSWSPAWPFANGSEVKSGYTINDFEMDSVIMPDHVMANYVEPARHAFVDTPSWHLLDDDVASRDGACSSNEDINDEPCKSDNIQMQANNQCRMDSLLPNWGISNEEKKYEKTVEVLIENSSHIGAHSVTVPRRKRRKRGKRWDIALYAKNFRLTLNNTCTAPPDGCKKCPNAIVEERTIL